MAQVSHKKFFVRYALPTLTALKQQRMIAGDFNPSRSRSSDEWLSVFHFFDSWEMHLRFRSDDDFFILEAVGIGKNNGIYHGVHLHPGMREDGSWTCIPDYENGPHLHLYTRRDTKIMYEGDIPLAAFLMFIASRHHADKYPSIKKVLGGTHHPFGLMARAGSL